MKISWFIFIALLTRLILSQKFCENLLKNKNDEAFLIDEFSKNLQIAKTEVSRYFFIKLSCIELLLKTAHFKTLDFYLNELNKQGIKYRETLNLAIDNIQKNLEVLHNKFKFDDSEFREVSPAFQWAQSKEDIFIQIKFAHRHDSPGCLEVKNENIDINGNIVIFTAYCVQADIPIKFKLKLELFDEVSKEESTSQLSSVGRFMVNLKKSVRPKYWKNLLKPGVEAPPNMKVWWEMRGKFEKELEEYISGSDDDFDEISESVSNKQPAKKKKKKKQNNLDPKTEL
jgi:hypothetical protein